MITAVVYECRFLSPVKMTPLNSISSATAGISAESIITAGRLLHSSPLS